MPTRRRLSNKLNSSPHIIVESVAAWRHAEAIRRSNEDTVWATTSPFVIETLTAAGRCWLALDGEVSQEEADMVGYVALAAAGRLAVGLDNEGADWPDGLRLGRAMHADLYGMLVSLLYKAYLLDRLRAQLPKEASLLAVGTAAIAPVTSFRTLPQIFDTIYSALCRRLGIEVIEFDTSRPLGEMSNGDFLRPTWWTRVVTVLNAPFTSLLYRVWRGFAGGRSVRLRLRRRGPHVAILKGNELVEEIFRSLLLRGATLTGIETIADEASDPDIAGSPSDAALVEVTVEACREAAREHGLAWSSGLQAAAELAGERICSALWIGSRAASGIADYCADLKKIADGAPLAVVTNALARPIERLLQQGLCKANVPVYIVDHGTGPGLDDFHRACFEAGLAPPADAVVCFNECQRQAESRERQTAERSSVVTGVPSIVRNIGFRALQRHAVRRMLRADNRLVAWVTGLYPNNLTRLPHYFRDTPYHKLRKRVVYDVLGKLDDAVLIKLYPTYRYADPDPFAGLMQLPDNCRFEQFVDFRNLRAGVDVILLDTPGSGLAWCWSVGVPLIYLETGMMTLLPEIAEQFRDAIFYVDMRESGWEAVLRELLELPHDDLLARYQAKAASRERVSEFCVLGPNGTPGRRAARFIIDDLASMRDRAA